MALKQYPNNSSILLLKVEALIIDNKIKEAQKLIDQLYALEENNSEVIIQKARIFFKEKII